MGFHAPIQFAWAATMIVVVLLYLHWALRHSHPTTTLPIWEHALARRTWWSRWRRFVSILAACFPIVLIALALAQPFLSPFVASSRSIVIVIDNTASMNAQRRGRSRLEDAKHEARRLIRNLRTHDRMAILSASSTVEVGCGLTRDRTSLHRALDAVQPTDGVGAMQDCLTTAKQLVEGETRPVVVVISDAAFDAGDSATGEEVVWIPVSRKENNLAITNIAARPALDAANMHLVLIEISNFSDEAAATQVELQLAGKALSPIEVQIPPGESVQRIANIAVDQPALLTASLSGSDAISGDDTARLLVSPPQPTRVALVTQQAESPVAVVLQSLHLVEMVEVEQTPDDAAEFDLIVYDGTSPRTIPAAPALVLGPTVSTELWTIRGRVSQPLAEFTPTHPLLRGVDFRDVIVDNAVRLELQEGSEELVTSTTGDPLVAVIPRTAGDVAIVGFALGDSDLDLHDDFPRLISNAVQWLASEQTSTARQWRTTDTLGLSEGNKLTQITSPYGEASNKGANLTHAGIWQAEASNNAAAILPVNLTSTAESDLRARDAQRSRVWPHVAWLPDFGPLWMPLVALALVWMAAHWAYYQREVID